MQPRVPYWQQPSSLGVPSPNPNMGQVNLARGMQAAQMVYTLGKDMEARKKVTRTQRYLAKLAHDGTRPNMEDIHSQDLELGLIERSEGLRSQFRDSQWNEVDQVAQMAPEVYARLKQENPQDRAPFLKFMVENAPNKAVRSAYGLLAQGVEAYAMGPDGTPLMDERGRPIIPDEAVDEAIGSADLLHTMAKARQLGLNERHTKWADSSSMQKLAMLSQHPKFNQWTSKELNFMMTGKLGKKGDGQTLDYPDFSLLSFDTPSAYSDKLKGYQPGPQAEGGGGVSPMTQEQFNAEGGGAMPGVEPAQDDLNADPEGVWDWTIRNLQELGDAAGRKIEDIAANMGDTARDAIRALPGGGHLVGQEEETPVGQERVKGFLNQTGELGRVEQPEDREKPKGAQKPIPQDPTITETDITPESNEDYWERQRQAITETDITPESNERQRQAAREQGRQEGLRRYNEQIEGEKAGEEMERVRQVERGALDSIMDHEGFDLTWRKDAGGDVIGHGLQRANLAAMMKQDGKPVPDKISRVQARRYTMRYIRETALPGAQRAIGRETWATLSPARQSVLVELVYQIGEDGLDIGGRKPGFNRMIRAIRKGDFDTAARELVNSDLGRQTRRRAKTLAKRLREG